MTNKIKALGLVLVAVMAMSALATGTGQATNDTPEFTAGKGNTQGAHQNIEIFGVAEEEGFHAFGWSGVCENVTYENQTPFQAKTATVPATSFTAKPVFKLCKTTKPFEITIVTFETHKCSFRFHVGATENDAEGKPIPDTYTGTVDVECENAGEAMELKVYTSLTSHEAKEPLCTVRVTPQTGLPITFKVDTAGPVDDIKVFGPVKGIHAHQIRTGFLCPSGFTTNTAEYTFPAGGRTLQARNEAAEDIHLWVD